MLQQLLPLKNQVRTIDFGTNLNMKILVEAARFSLRIDQQHLDDASKAFGVQLPRNIGDFISENDKMALCIGPDEWHLIAPENDVENIENSFAKLYEKSIHSLVDISHREVSIVISGHEAAYLLQAIIAFDIDKMPIQSCRRTIMDKSQIILLRQDVDLFRIEIWNSYVSHIWHLLEIIGKEIEVNI